MNNLSGLKSYARSDRAANIGFPVQFRQNSTQMVDNSTQFIERIWMTIRIIFQLNNFVHFDFFFLHRAIANFCQTELK